MVYAHVYKCIMFWISFCFKSSLAHVSPCTSLLAYIHKPRAHDSVWSVSQWYICSTLQLKQFAVSTGVEGLFSKTIPLGGGVFVNMSSIG